MLLILTSPPSSISHRAGLRLEDFYNAENPEIQEVLRRLPNKTKEERDLRIRRGHELHLKGATLPESSWTTPEEDGKTYMEPYMSEVVQEIEERKDFRADFLRTPPPPIYWLLRAAAHLRVLCGCSPRGEEAQAQVDGAVVIIAE